MCVSAFTNNSFISNVISINQNNIFISVFKNKVEVTYKCDITVPTIKNEFFTQEGIDYLFPRNYFITSSSIIVVH